MRHTTITRRLDRVGPPLMGAALFILGLLGFMQILSTLTTWR